MIPIEIQQLLEQHAERDYPNECCGLILEHPQTKNFRFRPCRNIQNTQHRENKAVFPRTARTAYWIDSKDLVDVQKEIRESGEKIAFIYHSHIDAPAYFSLEDKTMAVMDGEPLYPETDYLVLSVCSGKARDWKIFRWDSRLKDYTMAEKSNRRT